MNNKRKDKGWTWIVEWLRDNSPHLQQRKEFYERYVNDYNKAKEEAEEETSMPVEGHLSKTMFFKAMRDWYGYGEIEVKQHMSGATLKPFFIIKKLWDNGEDFLDTSERTFTKLKRYQLSKTGSIIEVKIYETRADFDKDYPEAYKYGNIMKAALGYVKAPTAIHDKPSLSKTAYGFKWKVL